VSRILVVEDEPGIASFIAKGLKGAGHGVVVVADGRIAARVARDEDFDLVLLDLGLPGLDGHGVLARIRERGEQLPVIILTARSGLEDAVGSLDSGADDYVTKPFRFEELLARIKARLRGRQPLDAGRIEVDDIVLDLHTRRLHVGDRSDELSAREFGLAELLMDNAGEALTRERILSQVWGYDHDPGSNIVDVYVGYLRRKVGHERIETVRGVGYRFVSRA
jgi:DNA-binding response OmpR family regulator